MTVIILHTEIQTTTEKAFQLSLDIDFHKKTASQTQEEAIAGITSGIIKYNETVTWRGKHFGVFLTHTSQITAYEAPTYFVDEMIKGNFKSFRHQHFFEQKENTVHMKDIITYSTPYGIFGKLFDSLLLKKHLTDFIKNRNQTLKTALEK
ncbi:SRPBCC family protein [uncultured Dokdonia sp.]|uniref:SRPBCC family protein n=1 Tax=uncultured Dokdonia sp. TaxID=575653 RepID=UPI00262E6D81|nr:SRPBCC family protein [uncultured Dokdonia sp.]